MVFAAPEKTYNVLHRLTYKTQKWVIPLPCVALGFISQSVPLLICINTGNVRIQTHGNSFRFVEAISKRHEGIKVEANNLQGSRNLQGPEEMAESRLNWEKSKAHDPLK
jgi:hypothetical protein